MRSVAILGSRGYPSYYGGFETAVRELAPFLAERGWDVTVYGREGETTPDDPNRNHEVKSVNTGGLSSKSLSTLSHGLTSALSTRQLKPDVALVVNVANGFFLPLMEKAGIPTVVNVDGIEWERAKWGGLAKTVFRKGADFTAKHASEIIVDAKAIGDRWRDGFGVEGHFIPYGGVDDGELPYHEEFPRGEYLLYVARFVPENSFDVFLEAATEVAEVAPVVIVGSSGFGDEADERVKELAESNPNIHWLGHIRDNSRLHALWQNCGAYFHGHSVGGTNPALVQAMMCGAPTIARDTVYSREVLAENAIFVEPETASIVAAARDLLADPTRAKELSTGARVRALETYSWKVVCEAYEKVLVKAIEARQIK